MPILLVRERALNISNHFPHPPRGIGRAEQSGNPPLGRLLRKRVVNANRYPATLPALRNRHLHPVRADDGQMGLAERPPNLAGQRFAQR
jgi:hypothetical protein